jgi:hypothetical protein
VISSPDSAARHSGQNPDRNFFLVMVIIAWIAILTGFASGISHLISRNLFNPTPLVYVHIVVYFVWMILFTSQVALIRASNTKLHRRVGKLGMVVALLVFVFGIMTAIASESRKFGTEMSDPAFLSLLFADILTFGVPTAMGFYLRKSPAEHKRLMLAGTIALLDAGFARWLSPTLISHFGNYYWTYTTFSEGGISYFVHHFMFPLLMMLSILVYDIIQKNRIYKSYLFALIWYVSLMMLSGWLYFHPKWLSIAKLIIGQS